MSVGTASRSEAAGPSSLGSSNSHLLSEPQDAPSPLKRQRLDEPLEEDKTQTMLASADLNGSAAAASSSSSASSSSAPQPPLPNTERLRKVPPELFSDYDPANFPAELPKSTAVVNYRKGLFLAPMVRIGSLPTRLLSLEYGADLVWGPEIVDRALMGSTRVVDEKTGTVHFRKDNKSVFSTHPVERPYLIFQLGCATPAWAYEVVKLVTEHDDVAGVDLNCGCPKNFSTTGGMGAGLLPRPDLLCDILRAMRRAAPPHVAVTCKLRLLPTEEETKRLIRMICATKAVDAITIHCRTKEMRPREKALLHRINEVVDTVRQETNGAVPVCHNGDSWDFNEAQIIMKDAKVTSSMLARGPEKNPSCFSPAPLRSVVDEIVPKWLKYAVMTNNELGNTKYCLGALEWTGTSNPGKVPRQKVNEVRASVMQGCKSNEEMCEAPYYKDKIDVAKCKDDWEEYVLGDLRRVLEQRVERRNEDEEKATIGGVPGAIAEHEHEHEHEHGEVAVGSTAV